MKALEQLNNVERAKLLFELHPGEIPKFLSFSKEIVNRQLSDTKQLRDNWNNGMITVDFWITLFKDVQVIINKYGTSLSKSKNLFSDQLFDGHTAFLSTTLLSYYQVDCKNSKFNLTIDLLFKF